MCFVFLRYEFEILTIRGQNSLRVISRISMMLYSEKISSVYNLS